MKKRLLFITIACGISLAACGANNDDNDGNTLPTKNENNPPAEMQDSSPDNKKDLTNREIAEHLSNIADSVPNVIDASAVVAGSYAVVGVNVDEDLDKSRVGTVKFSVTESLKHDPYGKTAVVVADADVTQRLQSMGNKIKQGEPVEGVVDELSEIVGRYMPDTHMEENQSGEPDPYREEPSKENEDSDETGPTPPDDD